ncbi:MAG: DNA polymerase III subunit gamma/tau [Mogibacterium diversum]|nr:DNA polymerase III subunit gamma/tau [Mogibacterium diversum]
MHLALYRSERPERFEEIIGQKHIVKILRNQIKKGTVSQSYLFAGTRGTGKTTTARILAKAVNCTCSDPGVDLPCGECANCRAITEGRFLDVVELDAASNNGVESLRQITESVQYPPTVGKYKVYIIDEAHMLTDSAENAFLKTLEEPPAHVIFILATTNPEKIKATIKSRCLTLNFRHVSENDLLDGMRRICQKKAINIEEDALAVIARKADGSVRDALSLLEQCINAGDELITRELVLEYTGGAGDDFYIELTDAIRTGEAGTALADIDSMVRIGKDAKQLLSDWLLHYRNLMICKYVQDPSELVNASSENTARIVTQAKSLSDEAINYGIRLLSDTVNKAKFSTMPRILLETCVIKLIVGESAEVRTEPVRINANIPVGARTPRTESGTPKEEPQATNAYEKQVQPRPNASAERAQDVEEPQPLFEQKFNPLEGAPPDRHIVEFEANQNLDEMWDRICDQMARTDAMFMAMVAKYTRLVDLHGSELTVEVKKTKSLMADEALGELNRITKALYGDKFYISLRVVEYNPADARELSQVEEPGLQRFDEELIDAAEEKDEIAKEVAKDVADFFGVDKIDIK